ncbi:hypothetical protein [Streptomyces qinzhouensis]|uniref:Uncharacterized protein n=1 Tax=Streptomyces qinzhouensis TaxID=2599401 RepID=A0A5B8J6W1_9ACTN|nr:hypothetical protein [Streptomyces qinzhouensis]QDY76174.1 hypothetical protein FQU76_06155 [Streptomyces qinzhouensis]
MRSRWGRGRTTGRVTLGSLSAWLITAVTVLAGVLVAGPPAAAADLPYGPYTCVNGFVWREAFPGDLVCVTPAIRGQGWSENALGPSRREPNGGPYGPDTCKQGFVWREARPSDRVCVPPPSRDQARSDNANAPWRLVSPGATPRGGVSVSTTPHQLGGWLYATGSGVSPYGAVRFYAVGINTVGPYSLGVLTATPSGTLPGWQYVADIRCRSGQTGPATIVVLDQASGLVTTAGTTDAFRRCG